MKGNQENSSPADVQYKKCWRHSWEERKLYLRENGISKNEWTASEIAGFMLDINEFPCLSLDNILMSFQSKVNTTHGSKT